jgi:transposase
MDEKDQIIAFLKAELERQKERYEEQIKLLKGEIEELKELLNRNSKNSSLPPSQDKPNKQVSKPNKKPRLWRKGYFRKRIPEKDLSLIQELKPEICDRCQTSNFIQYKLKEIRQTVEIPSIKPFVTEYRAFSCRCGDCGKELKARFPAEARKVYGPRMRAICTLLASKFRVSKRYIKELFRGLFGIDVCIGSISNFEEEASLILQPGWEQAKQALQKSKTVYADETHWKSKGQRQWLWQACDKQRVIFQIDPGRGKKAAIRLLGKESFHNLVTDRWRAYSTLGYHQFCWAHLKRDFKKVEERPGQVSLIGGVLGCLCTLLFNLDKEKRGGVLTQKQFSEKAKELRKELHYFLSLGIRADFSQGKLGRTGRFCERLLAQEDHLWYFIEEPSIDLTNNLSERNLRPAVIWRKVSFGTQSERGNRFVERILSAVETLKIQKRNVFEFLANCFRCHLNGSSVPNFGSV